jgi:hypothetical protein
LGISGSLRDVQIIDENNIWVVGEIETDSGKYGAAQWNGDYWELKKLKGPGISVQTITPRGLWYFSEDNIWFASGSIYHWNGTETSMLWQRILIQMKQLKKYGHYLKMIFILLGEEVLLSITAVAHLQRWPVLQPKIWMVLLVLLIPRQEKSESGLRDGVVTPIEVF